MAPERPLNARKSAETGLRSVVNEKRVETLILFQLVVFVVCVCVCVCVYEYYVCMI